MIIFVVNLMILLQNMEISLDHPKLSRETTVQGAITEVAAMVGENVKLRRGFALSTSSSSHGVISTYLHTCPKPGTEILTLSAFLPRWKYKCFIHVLLRLEIQKYNSMSNYRFLYFQSVISSYMSRTRYCIKHFCISNHSLTIC